MNLPENADVFVTSVESDCRRLIDLGLWPVSLSRFEGWLRQYCGQDERFFAACVLNQLTLRTAKQFESGLASLFRGSVSAEIFPDKDDLALAAALAGRSDPRIRLVPVICEADPPTKSGPLVLRRLQRILRIHPKWMVWPWQATSLIDQGKVDVIVFVDDLLGSGSQFEKFANQWGFISRQAKARYIYAPVTAHETGLAHIGQALASVKVLTTERLTSANGFFSQEVWSSLGQGAVTAAEAMVWYEAFATRKEIQPKSAGTFGVGDLALTFGFSHSTPNNSIPLLWYESAQWQPLLER